MIFPSGYRFLPTDEELVVDYLRNKILKKALPCNVIEELNLYDYHPQQLYDLYKKEGDKFMYFFTPRDRKYPHGNRPKRQAGDGYWKASGVDLPVTVNNIKVASKRSLVYYSGSNKNSTKTNWIMYEYVMDQHSTRAASKPAYSKKSQAAASSSHAPPEDNNMRLDDWVLCKVYSKNHKSKNKNQAASGSGGKPIISGPEMHGNGGSNYDHDSASLMASMQRIPHNVGDNNGVVPFIQRNDRVNLQHNLDYSTASMASIQEPYHSAAAYHNPYHHQYNLQNCGCPILSPLQISQCHFVSSNALEPMAPNDGPANFAPERQAEYNGQHYVSSIRISPWTQPNYIVSTSTAMPMIKNECTAANYVGSTSTAPAVQGANACENTDAIGSTNHVADNFFGSTTSATPMQSMDQCNVADDNTSFNSESFLTEFDHEDSYFMVEDPNIYLDSFDRKT